jgi:hypothetical protein
MIASESTKSTAELADAGREFYRRGWVLGTSGNFSMLTSRDPMRVARSRSAFRGEHTIGSISVATEPFAQFGFFRTSQDGRITPTAESTRATTRFVSERIISPAIDKIFASNFVIG